MDGKVAIEKLTTLKNTKVLVNGQYTALDVAIKALEKQTPKKTTYFNERLRGCPMCPNLFGDKREYCSCCGQKLDWN